MTIFPASMESERLRYERLHLDEIDPFELYMHARVGAPNVEDVTEYVSWEPYDHPKDAYDWIERCGKQFEAGAEAVYVLRLKDGDHAGELAGVTSLCPDWVRHSATLGLWLRKRFWGRRYSEERAARLLTLTFDCLDLDVVAVTHDPKNDNSKQAIERYVDRFGGRKVGRIRNGFVKKVRFRVDFSNTEKTSVLICRLSVYYTTDEHGSR